ncbi:hypothetical protein Vretimale_8486, partial [Volvox reticuliferus]
AISARLSFMSIELHERQLPPGADAAALAAAPPPESELPPLLPYSFVTPEFAETGNMVELVVTDISAVPNQLQTANELAGGKVTVAAAIKLPGSGPTVVVHLPLAGGQAVVPALRRDQLTAEACTELQYHLEDGQPLSVEVARYVAAEHFSDPAWEAYHAMAPVTSTFKSLLAAGATSGSAEALPLTAFTTADGAKSHMPPYTPPPGKSKPIEEPPPSGTCFWEKIGARLSFSFRLARPIIPPWQPPPPPPRSLLEMIPPRDLTPKPPPTTAADDFKAKVRTVARALAVEYKSLLPPPGYVDGSGEGGGGGAEARHKALVFELNRSGKYAQMRDSLKASVVALVREKYRKSGSMSPNEMALLYNDLYGTLLAAMHSALNDMIDTAAARPREPLPEPVPDKQRLGQLLELAAQAEALGDVSRAEALHQRRLLARTDAQVWYEYGTYCLRRGSRGRAEQCFREALSLEPTHRPALLALLGCSVAEGRATDPAYLEAAEAAAHRLMEVSGQPTLEQWAMMALVYKAYGGERAWRGAWGRAGTGPSGRNPSRAAAGVRAAPRRCGSSNSWLVKVRGGGRRGDTGHAARQVKHSSSSFSPSSSSPPPQRAALPSDPPAAHSSIRRRQAQRTQQLRAGDVPTGARGHCGGGSGGDSGSEHAAATGSGDGRGSTGAWRDAGPRLHLPGHLTPQDTLAARRGAPGVGAGSGAPALAQRGSGDPPRGAADFGAGGDGAGTGSSGGRGAAGARRPHDSAQAGGRGNSVAQQAAHGAAVSGAGGGRRCHSVLSGSCVRVSCMFSEAPQGSLWCVCMCVCVYMLHVCGYMFGSRHTSIRLTLSGCRSTWTRPGSRASSPRWSCRYGWSWLAATWLAGSTATQRTCICWGRQRRPDVQRCGGGRESALHWRVTSLLRTCA